MAYRMHIVRRRQTKQGQIMKSIKFAFIQSGYSVFGVGYTRQQAISDARKWLSDTDGQQGGLTFRETEELLDNDPVDGNFRIIASDDEEFDSYMENHGGFEKRGRGWYSES